MPEVKKRCSKCKGTGKLGSGKCTTCAGHGNIISVSRVIISVK